MKRANLAELNLGNDIAIAAQLEGKLASCKPSKFLSPAKLKAGLKEQIGKATAALAKLHEIKGQARE
eukprot:4725219-Alexandrium_andersonii.AAC.1